MSAALMKKKQGNGLPAIVVVCCALSVYIVLLSGCLVVQIVTSLLALQFIMSFYYLCLLALVAWGFTGIVIQTGLTIDLLRSIRKQDYFTAERKYLRFIRLWTLLPIRKGGQLGLAYSNLAYVRIEQGKYEEAEPVLREAVKLFETDRRLSRNYVMPIIINNLAVVLASTKQYPEAEQLSKRALSIFEARSPGTCAPAFALLNLGVICLWQHMLMEANPAYRAEMINLGAVCLGQNRIDEADRYLDRAKLLLETAKKPLAIIPQSFEFAYSTCLLNFALLRFAQGRSDDALYYCKQLMAPDKVCFLTVNSLEAMAKLADNFLAIGNTSMAEQVLEQTYLIGQRQPDHRHTAQLLDTYAALLTDTGRGSEVADMRRWIRPIIMPAVVQSKSES